MARGALAKEKIFQKILETFEGSFMYNNGKELRIPFDEEGTPVQIKVALTCAKDNVSPEGGVIEAAAVVEETANFPKPTVKLNVAVEPTKEEKENIENLLNALGLN